MNKMIVSYFFLQNQRSIFNLEEVVKNVYDALKSRRTHFN